MPAESRVVLLTGATSGLGRLLAGALAGRPGILLLHGRDPVRLAALVAELSGGAAEIRPLVADLASLAEVDQLADAARTEAPALDLLLNNAGVGFGAPGIGREVSRDGIELRLAVDYLAPYRLQQRLADALVAGAERSGAARIVNVASIGQAPIDLDDLQSERDWDGTLAYRRAKLALIAATIDIAGELAGRGVTANSLHPGTLMDTGMVRESRITPVDPIEQGVTATLRLAEDPDLAGVSGTFFRVFSPADPLPQALDPAWRRALRDRTEALLAQVLGQSVRNLR